MSPMRIVTWNVNSLRARLTRVLELLAEHGPDVVCLQETKCAPDTFPHEELAQAGYAAVHHSTGQWAGVALLARSELELREPRLGLPGEPGATEARRAGAAGPPPPPGRGGGVARGARGGLERREPRLGLPGEPVATEARWCEA